MFDKNHFELFQLAVDFEIDLDKLHQAYYQIQKQIHPDRFANRGDIEKKLAMTYSTQVNEAYQTLKDPLRRALYWCSLHNIKVESESNTQLPPSFLMQQMEWREVLEEALSQHDQEKIDKLKLDVGNERIQLINTVSNKIQIKQLDELPTLMAQWMFFEKLLASIAQVNHSINGVTH